jgi:hypothetical protein
MLHLRLNVYNGHGATLDPEGGNFVDLADARRVAIEGIRSFLSAEVLEGELDLHGHLEIIDDGGTVVDSIPFSEAVKIVDRQAITKSGSGIRPNLR